MIIYIIIFVLLLIAELLYFRIANKCNIIDKPNERSSHSTIVLRGGGIIFLIGVWIWSAFFGFQYPWFLVGLTLVAGISFVDDIHSLPDSVRLVAQFSAAAMAFYQLGILHWAMWWIILLALIVYVGATNVINFMDGINGITAGYSLVVLVSFSSYYFFLLFFILSSLKFNHFYRSPLLYAPSFASNITEGSITFIVCHAPAGIWIPNLPSAGDNI
jgi:UDP-N-acetylmuramyl pentapeptide phosphotransferase/UDP-N-acetylglucosamine-1-phosphate transferase